MSKLIKELAKEWKEYRNWYYNESLQSRMPTMDGFMNYLLDKEVLASGEYEEIPQNKLSNTHPIGAIVRVGGVSMKVTEPLTNQL